MKPTDFTIGQRLWFVPSRQQGHTEIVVRIGRKWVTTAREGYEDVEHLHSRFAPPSWAAGGGYFWSGTYYSSEADYAEQQANDRAWDVFAVVMRSIWRRPGHLDAAAINAIRAQIEGGKT